MALDLFILTSKTKITMMHPELSRIMVLADLNQEDRDLVDMVLVDMVLVDMVVLDLVLVVDTDLVIGADMLEGVTIEDHILSSMAGTGEITRTDR